MADKLLDLPGLTYYDGKIKTYIAEKDSEVTSNLEQQLQQEAQSREAADTQLQQNIDTEESERIAADTTLQQNINNEATTRFQADNTLQDNINDEQSAREAEDTKLQNNIDAEESARQQADTQLQTNIDAEASTREQVDTQLNTKIDTTKAEILGDVSKEYNTLGKLEDAIQAEVSRATNEEESINADLQSFKTSTNESIEQINNTLDSHNTRITNLEENTVKKTGETSQTIQGNIAIQGDLTVSGTTTSQDHETIMVQDNIIVTNSNGVPIVGLSGIAIRMNSTQAFGIVYDPATDELKSGIGTLNESNEFTFDSGEGYPVTLRDSDNDLVDGNILMWDNVGKRLVDGGILANNIAQQNGNYQEMFVGRATSDANGNNIADTYLEKDVIPQPTAEDNGKILGVQNSVYTLIENRQGTYYVDLNDITLTDEDTSGTLSADLVQQLVDENCLGVFINATYADTSSVVKRAFYKVYSGSITEMSSNVCAFLSTDALKLAETNGATRYTELTISQALFGFVYTDTSSTAQYSLSNFSSGQFTLTKPSYKTSVTSNMTQEVYVDNNGKLWTLPVQAGINWATNEQIDDMFIVIPETHNLSTDSWDTVAKLSRAGFAQNYYSVGDEKTIELSTGEQVTLVILGFNHDDLSDSSGKAGITFGMKNLLATKYRMNATDTNEGGWNGSGMRTSTMATLLSQLPSDLQSVIKQVNKKATAGSQSTTITISADKLWLLSEVEIDGTTAAGYADEGKQYEYWKTVKDGKTSADRIKYLSNGIGSANAWWLRSPAVGGSGYFRYITSGGAVAVDNFLMSNTYGVSFGFCI